MLWCDFFARQSRSAAAWAALAGDGMDASTTRRLLSVSGPVEFALKDALYRRLLPDHAWHAEIFRSLLMSWSDSFGHIDYPRARAVLAALAIPPGTDGLAALCAGLASELRPWERGSHKGAPPSNL
ncbi:hypothetical protein F8S13_15145 [Chloroflexia bacterium SDU3-3]|nr:hypothetical protein F8S13_15145 [Chloroflexia bacterium SDU3-3]